MYTHIHMYAHTTHVYRSVLTSVSVLCCSHSLYRHYYGDRVSKQCRLCHPLCDGTCSGEVFSIFFLLLHSIIISYSIQGPSNCSKCVSSSLFVNRSNVIECVGSTCPTGWYDGTVGECVCVCVCVYVFMQ